jgi:hypothetical protein
MVEPHLPGRHVRHENHTAGGAHRADGVSGSRVVAYVCLLGTWILVAVRTARGSVQGYLFQPPSTIPVKAHKDPVN